MFHVRQEQNYSCHYTLQESEHPLDRLTQSSNYLAGRPIMLSRNRYGRDRFVWFRGLVKRRHEIVF